MEFEQPPLESFATDADSESDLVETPDGNNDNGSEEYVTRGELEDLLEVAIHVEETLELLTGGSGAPPEVYASLSPTQRTGLLRRRTEDLAEEIEAQLPDHHAASPEDSTDYFH